MTFILGAMAAIVTIFGLVALKAGAAYRFRGKMGLAIEGIAFIACAVIGIFTSSLALLGIGIAAGVGMRQIKSNEQRYLE